MGKITSLFVWKFLHAARCSADTKPFLQAVGIDPDDGVDPSHMISDADYYAFIERLAAVDEDPATLPLRTGASMQCDEYGAFGLAWKSALNVRGSYERAERYARVLTSVATYQLEPADEGAYMCLHREGERRLGMRMSNEATIASILAISRQVSSTSFGPRAVYFKHPAPESTEAHETHFGCPVHFETERDALLVSEEALSTPNVLGDASISSFFDAHLEAELAELDDDSSLGKRVRIQVSQSLSEGVPTVSDVGRRLGMSARTLQRRLADQGYSYQGLVDEARRELSERLLRQTDYSLSDIAFLTGFSEQSAFTRAFRRWSGQTPRSYRFSSPS